MSDEARNVAADDGCETTVVPPDLGGPLYVTGEIEGGIGDPSGGEPFAFAS